MGLIRIILLTSIFLIPANLARRTELEELVADKLDDMPEQFGTNYASSYLGARIVDFSPEMNGVHRLLTEDLDKYMVVPCNAQRKRITIQLSREILVGNIRILNREYFSSTMKNFSVVGSKDYPCNPPNCMWEVLGSYSMLHDHSPQNFPVNHPISLRNIRILWVTHHHTGDTKCTLTQIGVYGTEMWVRLADELKVVNSHIESMPIMTQEKITPSEETILEDIAKQAEEPSSTNNESGVEGGVLQGVAIKHPFSSASLDFSNETMVSTAVWRAPKKPIVFLNKSSTVCEPIHEYFTELLEAARVKHMVCPVHRGYLLKTPDAFNTIQLQLKNLTENLRALNHHVQNQKDVLDSLNKASDKYEEIDEEFEEIASRVGRLEAAHKQNLRRIEELIVRNEILQTSLNRLFLGIAVTGIAILFFGVLYLLVFREPRRTDFKPRSSSALSLRKKDFNAATVFRPPRSPQFGHYAESEGTPDEMPL